MGWKERVRDILIKPEPPLPDTILGAAAKRFAGLPAGETVCIKVSAAHDLPYPFCVSPGFAARMVEEIHAANSGLRIVLTEGGVGGMPVCAVAEKNGLAAIPHATFLDAEAQETEFVPNPDPAPCKMEGFWLPVHWTQARIRVLLTTGKLRSHHFQRWYSGGTRNLVGLLPRDRYRLSSSRRAMRSVLHQQGLDATAADLYATTGRGVLTILDGRLIARQDEHIPLRFTRRLGRVLLADDPADADRQMVEALSLPFLPPYLAMIAEARQRIAPTSAVP